MFDPTESNDHGVIFQFTTLPVGAVLSRLDTSASGFVEDRQKSDFQYKPGTMIAVLTAPAPIARLDAARSKRGRIWLRPSSRWLIGPKYPVGLPDLSTPNSNNMCHRVGANYKDVRLREGLISRLFGFGENRALVLSQETK
jgi:hypothetical protein